MLEKMHKTISMADLLADHKRIAREMKNSGTVYRVREPGRRRLAVVDSRYMESVKATVEFRAAHPNWREEFAQADREFAAGLYWDLDDVMRDLGYETPPPKKTGAGGTRKRARSRDAKAKPRIASLGRSTTKRSAAPR
jgi:hypothetical protein